MARKAKAVVIQNEEQKNVKTVNFAEFSQRYVEKAISKWYII